MTEKTNITTAPLLLGNLLISLYVFLDKFILYFTGSYKLLRFIHKILQTAFLFFISILPSLISEDQTHAFNSRNSQPYSPLASSDTAVVAPGGDQGIARALSQILAIINNIRVTSRKYEVLRALAERLIDDNNRVGRKTLREVNRVVLSAAFDRTLGQYEMALEDESDGDSYGGGGGEGYVGNLMHVMKVTKFAWRRIGWAVKAVNRPKKSAEKLAAELLWLAQKLAACGCGVEAVRRWASASNLARLSIVIEPRMQGSLLKISAFIFKLARESGVDETGKMENEHQRQIKMEMLMAWLPFLCRANNGTEAPVLSISERVELENILEETIKELNVEEEQEKVMSLWLFHFMHCQTSDWPNLQQSYVRWFTASRDLLLNSEV